MAVPPPCKTVATLLQPGTTVFELAITCEVFGTPRPELGIPWYDFSVCSSGEDAEVTRPGGLSLGSPHGLDRLADADLVFVPWGDPEEQPPAPVLDALRHAHGRGARIAGLCSGAFVLAHAGLLDGRRATTHWRYADALADHFPDVTLDPDVLYVDEDPVFTSAGTAAGLDLCLHLVRLDHGAAVAATVAARLVVPPHRDGSQAQIVTPPTRSDPDRLALVLDWAVAHLEQPLSVDDLAERAYMSPRTFARRFVDTVGTTPLQWLLHQRLLHARSLLERTDQSVEAVARRSGFRSAAAMRTHFSRVTGLTPATYRRQFRGRP